VPFLGLRDRSRRENIVEGASRLRGWCRSCIRLRFEAGPEDLVSSFDARFWSPGFPFCSMIGPVDAPFLSASPADLAAPEPDEGSILGKSCRRVVVEHKVL
jgi:hypothetical protein